MELGLIAVDPGEKHVGIARFSQLNGEPYSLNEAFTTAPQRAIDLLWLLMERGAFQHVVVEEWRVYPGHSVWSTCETAEVIGALRHKARWCNIPFYTLPARVKKPAAGWCRVNQIKSKGDTVHAKDAELIGWAWINGVRG